MNNIDINSLIAEEIMGYVWAKNPNHSNSDDYGWLTESGWRNGFTPMNNMKEAWEVVEVLEHDHKDLVWHKDKNEWCFILGKGTWGRWYGQGETAPEAICLCVIETLTERRLSALTK